MPQTWNRTRIGLTILAVCLLMLVHGDLGAWLEAGKVQAWGARTVTRSTLYAGAGVLVWLAGTRFDPWLERSMPSFGSRLLLGELGLLAAVLALSALVHGALFPLLMGRLPFAAGIYMLTYKAAVLAMLVYGWLVFSRSSRSTRDAAQDLQADANRLSAELERAELAILQAQIEPHFLFNTLALVKRQYRIDPTSANRVLDALVAFLETAAPALRRNDWTVGQELDLVQLYLDILTHRFGAALTHRIDLPQGCRNQRLPALVLATLVENAVRHGLAPKADAGHVAITGEFTAQGWRIEVADDGVGLRQQSGTGMGLSTVRARLRSAFGDAATLLVQPRQPAGVRAVLTFAGTA